MRKSKAGFLFIVLLAIDFAYSVFNFISGFAGRENNFLAAKNLLLSFLPLVALIFLSYKIYTIQDKTKLLRIKNGLIAYISVSVILGMAMFKLHIPNFLHFLLYSYSWWFYIVYILKYQMYSLCVDLAITIFYWVVYDILLVEISNLIPQGTAKSAEISAVDKDVDKEITSPSYKISIASRILLAVQTAFSVLVFIVLQEQKDVSGEHAMGAAFVIIIMILVRIVISLPTVVLSIVGIVKGKQNINKELKYNQTGLKWNIACLVISELQVFLVW